ARSSGPAVVRRAASEPPRFRRRLRGRRRHRRPRQRAGRRGPPRLGHRGGPPRTRQRTERTTLGASDPDHPGCRLPARAGAEPVGGAADPRQWGRHPGGGTRGRAAARRRHRPAGLRRGHPRPDAALPARGHRLGDADQRARRGPDEPPRPRPPRLARGQRRQRLPDGRGR
ncbi:MAG: Multicopper oxidase, partial [uncultured Thermomicrobiales bacterium]